jgi:hypothetical protein
MDGRAVFIDPAAASPRDCESGVQTCTWRPGRVARTHSSTASRGSDPGAALSVHFHKCQDAVAVLERLSRCRSKEQSRDLGPHAAVVIDPGLSTASPTTGVTQPVEP